jgi:hypothetical protein
VELRIALQDIGTAPEVDLGDRFDGRREDALLEGIDPAAQVFELRERILEQLARSGAAIARRPSADRGKVSGS